MSDYIFTKTPSKIRKVNTKNITIKTSLPAKGTKDFFLDLQKYESRSMHGQIPIIWKKASNFNIYDIANNKFIDFTSGIFISNIGHSNQKLVKNLKDLLNNEILSCYSYFNSQRKEYIKKLIKFTGLKGYKAYLVSSGTEATEAALKIMRMNGLKSKKNYILAYEGNWHGRTLGAQMMSGNLAQKDWIKNLDNEIIHLPFPYPWKVSEKDSYNFFVENLNFLKKEKIKFENIAGVMLETFQGWCSAFYPKNYIKLLRDFTKKNNIVMTFDEMQAGFARTGKNFGYQHYNVKPDLICVGKGMGGGVPLSGLIGRSDLLDLPGVGSMSSTHSANPLVCSAGLSVLNEIKSKKLVKKTFDKGLIITNKLNKLMSDFPLYINGIYGKGMIHAIIFNTKNLKKGKKDTSYIVSHICEKIMYRGLLVVHTGRESIKIGPPLTISKNALNEGLKIIIDEITETLKGI